MKFIIDKSIKDIQTIIPLLKFEESLKFIFVNREDINNSLLKDASGVIVRANKAIDKKLLEETSIKYVFSPSSGIDHLDIDFFEQKKIRYFHAPGCNSVSVINYVLAVIKILNDKDYYSLRKEKVGVIGYGNIGKKLCHFFDFLNIAYHAYDPFVLNSTKEDLIKIKEKCSLLTLHVPLTSKGLHPTICLIDEKFLNETTNKIIINTSRGNIIDSEAMKKNKNIIFVNDVWPNEPDIEVSQVKNSFIATPHIAGHSQNGRMIGVKKILLDLINLISQHNHELNDNITIVKDFYESKLKESIFSDLEEINNKINILGESKKFKELMENSKNTKEIPKNFMKARSSHAERLDFVLP